MICAPPAQFQFNIFQAGLNECNKMSNPPTQTIYFKASEGELVSDVVTSATTRTLEREGGLRLVARAVASGGFQRKETGLPTGLRGSLSCR